MLERIITEFLFSTVVPMDIMLIRIIGAVFLCGMIGFERRLHNNTAGVRTNMLIGLAAVMFSIITLHLIETFDVKGGSMGFDPLRLVEAVTAGVAFLAAGVVVYTRGDAKGLTTGASMWVSAAIGVSAGLGMWPLAIVATIIGIIILWILRKAEYVTGVKEPEESPG